MSAPPVGASTGIPVVHNAAWRLGLGAFLITGAYSAVALMPVRGKVTVDVPLTIGCAVALAAAIVYVAHQLRVDARTQFAIWFSLLFLNLAAVAVEGTLFAPAASPPSWLGANLLRLAVGSALMAGIVAALFRSRRNVFVKELSSRHWYAWLWRVIACATVYFILYLVLGGLNYELVTHPYYQAHAGSLTVPAGQTILLFEPVRGLVIAVSVLPLALVLQRQTQLVAIVPGALLFITGGVVPLLPQASLPLYLRIASLWEIFGQNFLTGVACAYLFVGKRRSRYVQTPTPTQAGVREG